MIHSFLTQDDESAIREQVQVVVLQRLILQSSSMKRR